jgi:hypothetical protein
MYRNRFSRTAPLLHDADVSHLDDDEAPAGAVVGLGQDRREREPARDRMTRTAGPSSPWPVAEPLPSNTTTAIPVADPSRLRPLMPVT